jgi:GTPase SAR1 family protein
MGIKGETAQLAAVLEEALTAIGGSEQARKLRELMQKQTEGDLNLVFCGHFSAGKSTLVNRLCGARLLPAGPVPTSANTVRIRHGAPEAAVYRRTGSGGTIREGIPFDKVDEACRGGEEVEAVEIRYPVALLDRHTVLVDTPGIDSTDAAHQLATQSAMHLADAVFYVMDYNYVQSAVNFAFVKRLLEAGKRLYLIINQIDKHREAELAWEKYREGVMDAFRGWGLEPAGYLFLSLKEPEYPRSEWNKLPALIRSLSASADQLKERNRRETVRLLVREALHHWRENRELEKELYREAAGEGGSTEALLAEEERLSTRIGELRGEADRHFTETKTAVQSVLDNANVTPADTRELAALYLDACRPGFRLGWLAGKARTEQERAGRLELFRRDLEEKAKAHLVWHLSGTLKEAGTKAGLASGELSDLLDGLEAPVEASWLNGHVQAGPDVTGEYVLNYCRLIAGSLPGN